MYFFLNYMITLGIGLEIRHHGVIRVWTIEDKTAVVVAAASYRNVSRNPVRVKALGKANYQYSDQLFPSKGYFSLNDFYTWAACNGQNSKE